MTETITEWEATLIKQGVPTAMIEQLEFLHSEVSGYFYAGGWKNPRAQAFFIARQLLQNAQQFLKLAAQMD